MKVFKANIKISDVNQRPFSRDNEILAVIILPNNKILLHTKSIYPDDTYRLPTGAFEKNETPEEAFRRELKEETNFDVKRGKLLAKLIYNIEYPNGKKAYTTYIFLVKVKSRKYKVMDEDEGTSGFKEIGIEELPRIAEKLRNLKTGPKDNKYHVESWNDWGRFRSIPHDIVYRLLSDKK
jgi:8-oxo-dGTP pyrophosphatase MutT (NUDIX family)